MLQKSPRFRQDWVSFTLSFLGYFALRIYTSWLGSGAAGIFPDFSSGRRIVTRVIPNLPGKRAALRAGVATYVQFASFSAYEER